MAQDVWQLVCGSGFKTSVFTSDSFGDVVIFCKTHLPTKEVYHYFLDLGTLLVNVKLSGMRHQDIELCQLHAKKICRTTQQSIFVASFQTQDPEMTSRKTVGITAN